MISLLLNWTIFRLDLISTPVFQRINHLQLSIHLAQVGQNIIKQRFSNKSRLI